MKTEQELQEKLNALIDKYFKDVHSLNTLYNMFKEGKTKEDVLKKLKEEQACLYNYFLYDKYLYRLHIIAEERMMDEEFRQIELLMYVLNILDKFGDNDVNEIYKYIHEYCIKKGYIKEKENKDGKL